MFRLLSPQPPGYKAFLRETASSKFIPYVGHWNDHTILTRDDSLIQVVRLSGFPFETIDDADLELQKVLRNSLFKGIASTSDVSLYFHITRRQSPMEAALGTQKAGCTFTRQLNERWYEKYRQGQVFVNDLYISIVTKAKTTLSAISSIALKLSGSEQSARIRNLHRAAEGLDEASSRVINSLKHYGPSLLGTTTTNHGVYSEIGGFLASVLDCGSYRKILLQDEGFAHALNTERLHFQGSTVTIRGKDGVERYGSITSIREYGPQTWPGMLDAFLKLPFEFVITQSFNFTNRQAMIRAMRLQQTRMVQADDAAYSQILAISEAADAAASGEVDFGEHHFSVMCLTRDQANLKDLTAKIAVALSNIGTIPVREDVNLEACFWGQLPGNKSFIVRKGAINTANLSGFNSLHNYPLGKATGNHWGEAVTVLNTISNTPYYFNFHLRDVGHTTIIGPTGSGKTVVMNFFAAQAQKYGCRLFFFDKDRGAEIFLRAINGTYTIIDPSRPCNFNPLALPDTSENRSFLLEWFKQLICANGEVVTAEDIGLINTAINGNYHLDFKDRCLRNVAPFLGLEGPGTIAGRLSMWHSNGPYAKLFDNPNDNIDFLSSKVFGFEMGELIKNKICLGPALLYIFHRISSSLDGSPNMIVLDEAWALIDNPVFAPKIKDWLKVLRKLNTLVVFATQSVEDATKSSISDTLVQQTATQIFLPNLKATEDYRTAFMLSEREFDLIRSIDPGSRYFLVKQGRSSIVARVDLSDMPDIISVLSGRSETINIMDEVRQDLGPDPDEWLPEFIARAQKLAD